MNNQSIIQYAKSRHIEDCVHFTNVLNLKSIINYFKRRINEFSRK